jgi:class 3 adenylate cyclase/ABC-type transport system involved in cytochrome c biogenesis ATPase subunit
MKEIVDWLTEIGMSEFAGTFVRHGIDLSVAQELTTEDLKDIGISRLVDRKILLREIKRVATEEAARNVQRRILSVLFCDLVDSTAFSHAVDAEYYREALKSYLDACKQVITKYRGFVANLFGDGVLAYFGWPRADEDQVSQAVRAGLEMGSTVKMLDFGNGLLPHCRVGIATGRVVIGGGTDLDSAFGETVNLAARLQSLAEPDRVVIDAATCRSIGNRFEVRALPVATLKGFPHPIKTWEVVTERRHIDRFEERPARCLKFVGRHAEMATLTRLWERLRSGRGQTVIISGEAGIGKSRLLREFCETLREQDAKVFRYQCSAYHVNSAFYPVVRDLERAAGIDPQNDRPMVRKSKLEKLLGDANGADRANLEIVAQLLSIVDSESAESLKLSATERRCRAIEFLVEDALRVSSKRPLVIAVEDVHWIDPSSKALLEKLISRAVHFRVMVVVTTRPGAHTPKTSGDLVEILLGRLSDDDIEVIVRSIDVSSQLSNVEIQHIVSQVDGIPLFAEELTSSAVEHSGTTGNYELPETIETSLTARMDFYHGSKEIVQIASVLGREFTRAELSTLAGTAIPASKVDASLAALTVSELLLESGSREKSRYRFKHALVQDVAYGTLLRLTRQQLHERVAREVLSETTRAREPEIVAYHLTEAGLIREALEYWKKAGELAAEKSANSEAISHFSMGLQLIQKMAPGPSRDALEFDFHVALSGPLITKFGYTSREFEGCVARALALGESVGHTPATYSLLYARWATLLVAGSIGESLRMAVDFSELAQRWCDNDALLARHRMLGASYLFLGELQRASYELEKLLTGYDSQRHVHLRTFYGVDLRVAGRCYTSEVLWLRGFVDQAQMNAAGALEEARAVNHANSIAMALHFCGLISFLNRNSFAIRTYAEEMKELTNRQPVGTWNLLLEAMTGWALVEEGHTDDGITLLSEGVDRTLRAGASIFIPFFYCRIAETFINEDRLPEAGKYLSDAEALIARTGEAVYRGELLRLQALLLLKQRRLNDAESLLVQAISCARRQDARSIELRAVTTYADVLSQRGDPQRGVAVLAAVVDGLTEGHGSHDMSAARATLARCRTLARARPFGTGGQEVVDSEMG